MVKPILQDPLFWAVFLFGVVVGVVGTCLLLVARGIHPPVDDFQLPTLNAVHIVEGTTHP